MTLKIGTDEDGDISIDPQALTKHLICLGMTGSGKTGLCIRLLEEAAKNHIPVMALDVKGDLTNIALDSAKLAKDRINVTLYTPGSTVGNSVNLLGGFQRGPNTAEEQDLATSNISSVFALLGDNPDPLSDSGHILLVKLLMWLWGTGKNPTLADLVSEIIDPPFLQVGVLELEQFMARKARLRLATRLNGILASPTTAIWGQGRQLDFNYLTKVDEATPLSIFYLAHLDSNQKQFFITQFMSRLLSWSRTLPGSPDLRALVFCDEAAGYLPPYPASPSTKRPIVMLFKQARGVGLGMMLATQNPVDLDYSVVANAGTWLLGRLQTRQDREKVLAGMQGHPKLGEVIATLKPREFVLQTISAEEPVQFRSSDTTVSLTGPVTLAQLSDNHDQQPKTKRFRHSVLGMESSADETLDQFTYRVQKVLDTMYEDWLEIHKKTGKASYDAALLARRKAEQKYNEAVSDAKHKKAAEAVGIGETILSFALGRRRSLAGAVSRRNTTSKANTKIEKLSADFEEANRVVNQLIEETTSARATEQDRLSKLMTQIESY